MMQSPSWCFDMVFTVKVFYPRRLVVDIDALDVALHLSYKEPLDCTFSLSTL